MRETSIRWILLCLVFSLGWIILIIGVNYAVDPYQYFRKAKYQPFLSGNQRYQNPGLARHYDYDTIVIGTSNAENFVNSYVDRVLGGKTLRLVMSGATAREEKLIAQIAIQTGKVKKIIWGIDYIAFSKDPQSVRNEKSTDFPHYFYDDNIFNDIKYLVNRDVFDLSMKIALDPRTYFGYERSTSDRLSYLNNWHDQNTYSSEKVKSLWEGEKKNPEVKLLNSAEIQMNYRANLKINLKEVIRNNPEITFMLFFPPYSVLLHRYWYEGNKDIFFQELKFKEHLFEELRHYSNVKIFDFQDIKEITHDFDYYKDFQHYSQDINEKIIDSIEAQEYLLIEENIDAKILSLKSQVEEFCEIE